MPEKTELPKIVPDFFNEDNFLDLVLILIWLGACILVIYLPVVNALLLTYIITIPLMIFIPGYGFIATLFPRDSDISLIERIALSFGFSVAIVSLIGLGLNFTPWGIRLDPIVLAVTAFTLLMILIAYLRRVNLPREERFKVPFHALSTSIRQGILPPGGSRTDRLFNTVLVIVILIALLTTIFVIMFPKEGERFSEFFILGDNRTADNYPAFIRTGQIYPMYAGVGNHEYRNINYTLETWMAQETFDSLSNSSTISAMDLYNRQSLALAHNETRILPVNLLMEKTGYNRLEFLLFKDSVPGPEVTGTDRINASYRNVNLWITIR